VNLIVDDFQQFTFNDPATGNTLSYNLYIPQDYDLSTSYPLVLFMPDSSVVSTQTIAPLVQGLGAVSWASPEDQAKRTCFVLAPNYPVVVIDDNYQPISLFDTTVNLVKALPQQYRIDTTRLYATGQSMGAMMTLGMNIKYPGLFAASLVVAGQWEPASDATPLANEKLWVVVSQGDDKAYPDENAIMDVIQGQVRRSPPQAGTDLCRWISSTTPPRRWRRPARRSTTPRSFQARCCRPTVRTPANIGTPGGSRTPSTPSATGSSNSTSDRLPVTRGAPKRISLYRT
jgi:hypothetical protein